MSTRSIIIVGMLFVVFCIVVTGVLDVSNKPIKQPEPVLNRWDYNLTEVKRYIGYDIKLYQGVSGECYLYIESGAAIGLSLVNCSDFMENNNG